MRNHSITGLDFGERGKPDFSKVKGDVESTVKALEYQLRERMTFVAPPDAIVGDMLYDLAHLSPRKESAHHTVALLRLAQLYNFGMPRPLKARLAYFQQEAQREAQRKLEQIIFTNQEPIIREGPPITQRVGVKHVDAKDLHRHLTRLVPNANISIGARLSMAPLMYFVR